MAETGWCFDVGLWFRLGAAGMGHRCVGSRVEQMSVGQQREGVELERIEDHVGLAVNAVLTNGGVRELNDPSFGSSSPDTAERFRNSATRCA
jgi:hypothetical protein